jgi:hypothetical protein
VRLERIFPDMDNHKALALDSHSLSPLETVRRRVVGLPSQWRRFGGSLLACYAIVAVFGATYGIVSLISADNSPSVGVVWGVGVAAPLALAFIWERLSGFKVFGVEVTLAAAFVRVDATLGTVLSATEEQYFSGNEAILELVDKVAANPDIELLEINLRTTRYWWSTRLYLQAALAEDYTQIQRLVFVDGDAQRRYVGMAAPGEVRRALAQSPGVDLESTYQAIRREVREAVRPPDHSEARSIVYDWAIHAFSKDAQPVGEEQVKTSMTTELLARRVSLETHFVEWDKPLDSAALQKLVLEKGVRFVALTQSGRLARIVNAEAFARHLAAETLRAKHD